MNHDEARLLIGAAPGEIARPLAEHLAQCPECSLFQQQMQRMEHDLNRLFATPLGQTAQVRVISLPIRTTVSRKPVTQGFPAILALAASLIISVGLGILFWSLRPAASLAAGVVDHVTHEPGSWSAVEPMTADATAAVLQNADVVVDPADREVTYARSCLFNGHFVPHLVVRTAAGPITVLVLNDEHIAARQQFRQNGYSGVLVPAPGGGTLAVIAQGEPDLDTVARAIGPHLHFTH
jgi:anti-sigma factor RsiW